MKKHLVIALLLMSMPVAVFFYTNNLKPKPIDKNSAVQQINSTKIGRIGEGYFNFEIADNTLERTKGLSGRDGLPETDALLFVFENNDNHCIWMKDMKFSIDILWFDENKKLIYEKRNISPDTYPENFCSDSPSKYVVEVASGVGQKNQITLGSELYIEL